MSPFESETSYYRPEHDGLRERHTSWARRKLEEFNEAHPAAAQVLLAGTSAAALIEHLANDNRWSVDNPNLPLTLGVVLGSASLSTWLSSRYRG